MNDRANSSEAITLQYADIADFARDASRRKTKVEESAAAPPFYRIALGLVPLQLGALEFRILMFLASKPYRPFSASSIAAAVTTSRAPVAEDEVAQHIASLREQLGFFRDYVQSVPYMGYRFKA
jgi:DNA-binding response OmpR family regulator